MLPASHFYTRQHKTMLGLTARCKRCINWHRFKDPQRSSSQAHGWVPLKSCLPVFLECHQRLGMNASELARRLERDKDGILWILKRRVTRVQAETVRRALELRDVLRAAGVGEAHCEWCGEMVVPSRVGRLKRFCSHSCASFALHA